VLDPDGDKESLASSVTLDNVDSLVRATLARQGFVRRENLLSKSRFRPDEISEALKNLEQKRRDSSCARTLRPIANSGGIFAREAIGLIDAAHKESPERAGVKLEELRSALRDSRAGSV
jgi:hypothetical protein